MMNSILLRLFSKGNRDLGAEILSTHEDAGGTAVDKVIIGWFAIRRRLLLGPGQRLGDALDWAAAPGVVLAGVSALAALVWQEWCPNAGPLNQDRINMLHAVAPFHTTGAIAFPIFVVAAIAATFGHSRGSAMATLVAWSLAVYGQIPGGYPSATPSSSSLFIAVLMGLVRRVVSI